MTDSQLAHAYPGLSKEQALLAVLSETLEMARDMKITQSRIKAAGPGQVKELIASAGFEEELETAEKTAEATMTILLRHMSEQDLQDGRDKGLLTPEDYQEALTAKRTMSLSRGRSSEREEERET